MGVSLSNCYQKNSQAQIQDDCGAKSVEDDGKKLVLRSNPKSIAQKIEYKKRTNSDSEFEIKSDPSVKYIPETSDSSSGTVSRIKTQNNKRMTENFLLNNSSSLSVDKKKLPHSFLKEDSNNFLTFEHSHRQMSFLGRTFKNIHNNDLNEQLDLYLEREMSKSRISFPQIEFSVEAIIETIGQTKENQDQNSVSVSVNISNKNQSHSAQSAQSDENPICKFIVISNIFIYDFEFGVNNSTLILRRRLNVLSVDFFSITPDFKKLVIHVNSILDSGGNIIITHENSIHIVFCICNILFHCYSATKNLIVIPHFYYFIEKSKKIFLQDRMKSFYNRYTEEIFTKIGSLVPYDKDEVLVKLIPLSKIETKFIDTKVEIMLVLTNKKILEISSENLDVSKINILPLSKMKRINELSKSHKFQIILEDGKVIQYSTLHSKGVIRLIKTQHAIECLLELEVIRID